MFCGKCGHKINDGDLFCEACGFKLDSQYYNQNGAANVDGDAPTVKLDQSSGVIPLVSEDAPTVKLDKAPDDIPLVSEDTPTVKLDKAPDDIPLVSEDAPTVKLDKAPDEIPLVSEDAPTVKLDKTPDEIPHVSEDAPTVKLDSSNETSVVPKSVYQPAVNTAYSVNAAADKKQKNNKYIIPIAICSVIFITVALLLLAFCFNLFGFKDAVSDLINGNSSEQVYDFEENEPVESVEEAEEPETEPVTYALGSPENPVTINGAAKNITASIGSSKQCNLKFTPTQTGYYYIQIPIGSQFVTFKTYDSSGNLMGDSEHHKEGSVNEYLYYDMFYAGETYTITASADSECQFKISFTDRTNDSHRVVYAYYPLTNLTGKYTYLRTFTPTGSSDFTFYATPSGNAGSIRLFDSNWNEIDVQMTDDGYGKTLCTKHFEKGKKYHFVIRPSGRITFGIGVPNTGM